MILELREIVDQALQDSISYEEYSNQLRNYAQEGKTSGPGQNADLIYYTKLNAHRSKRIAKTAQLSEDLVYQIRSIEEKQTWLLITETWCGDAANSVPLIAKLAELNPLVSLRIVLRDEQLKLIDQFLTNGGRSIPKLIVLDSEKEVAFTWGPRPRAGQELYSTWKNSENKIPYREFQVELQKWYNSDGGKSLQEELSELFLGEENMKSRSLAKLTL